MATNTPLADLSAAGVSVWLDDLSRQRIESGNLTSLIEDDEVVGVTSNPTIFASAFADADRFGPAATWTESIGGRELAIAMIRGPGGEPVELLELPRT